MENNNSMEMSFRKDTLDALKTHTNMMKLHYKTLACHCECMGMMSENMLSAIYGTSPKFDQQYFNITMFKWGLIDKEGKVII
jgi:hypothetical protein